MAALTWDGVGDRIYETGVDRGALYLPASAGLYTNGAPRKCMTVGQQRRSPFGLSYRTIKGNDVDGSDYGYKLHLVYGALAAPTEKAHATVNDTPEAVTFSTHYFRREREFLV